MKESPVCITRRELAHARPDKFLESSFEPNLISKHLTSFEDWGGCSQEVVTVVCSKLPHSTGGTHGYSLQVFCR